MKIIAYFLYGNRDEYKLELALSLISAIGQENLHAMESLSERITYCVVTDQENLGYPLPVEILRLAPDELDRWTDSGAYNHRAKPMAMLKVLDHYKCPVAMIDTDTYFIDTPQKIFEKIDEKNSVMHDFEYLIGAQQLWAPLLNKINGKIDINGYTTDSQSAMFNSGVIGVSHENRILVEDSLKIIDALYSVDPIFNIEQFALGLTLNTKTKLHICSDAIRHYWGVERDFVRIQAARFMKDFSESNVKEKIEAVIKLKFGLPRIPLRFKLTARVLGVLKSWTGNQRFAYMCSRCREYYSISDKEYAAAWQTLASSMAR